VSGGAWDHEDWRAAYGLEVISESPRTRERWPVTSGRLGRLAEVLRRELRAMDYALSGDSSIDDDAAFEAEFKRKVLEAFE
jgi:hypothetical protein